VLGSEALANERARAWAPGVSSAAGGRKLAAGNWQTSRWLRANRSTVSQYCGLRVRASAMANSSTSVSAPLSQVGGSHGMLAAPSRRGGAQPPSTGAMTSRANVSVVALRGAPSTA
jgi:hypothetical protein